MVCGNVESAVSSAHAEARASGGLRLSGWLPCHAWSRALPVCVAAERRAPGGCTRRDASAVESQLKLVARPMYSNPPLHGALLVTKILQDPELKAQWYKVGAGGWLT